MVRYQTFWKRFFAGIIDGLFLGSILILAEQLFITGDKWIFIGYEFFCIICWLSYNVVSHGKYGQTPGKKIVGIKVLDISEKTVIGYKRAFFRDSIWFFVSIAGLVYLIYTSKNATFIDEQMAETYNNIVAFISMAWFIVELITMFSNNKRRAVHDFIANSVVIDLKEADKES